MKRIILLSLLLLLQSPARASDLSGAVRGRLTVDQSPYLVIADITVPMGDTLTIEAGVVLEFQNSTSLVVKGRLQVQGAFQDTVFFRSASQSPQAGDWNGIFFQNAGAGEVRYAVVEHAATGITCDAAAPLLEHLHIRSNNNGIDFLNGARGLVRYSLIEKNKNAGVRAVSASPHLRFNVLRENGRFGFESAVVLENADSSDVLANLIYRNSNSGVDVTGGVGVRILQNTVAQNDMGITVSDAGAEIINNIVAFNGSGLSAENSQLDVRYNAVWSNFGGDFINLPDTIGARVQVNANGDSVDAFFNLQADPQFVDAASGDFRTHLSSPCIDAGDPANPAAVSVIGAAPDIGVFENSGQGLPVELVTFEFRDGRLHWRTASERNNLGFYVESSESADGPFVEIGFVAGRGTRNSPSEYWFDPGPVSATTFFRLRQVDYDGATTFSEVIRVAGLPQGLSLAVYPNPYVVTRNSTPLRLILQLPQRQRVRFAVYDLLGRRVAVLVDEVLEAGQHTLSWNAADVLHQRVAVGTYFYRLETPDRSLKGRFLVIRR